MTISAGGGLGADWAAGNYGYIVEDDAFFYVGSVATNVLTVGSATPMPWSNSVNSVTNTKTIRRYDSTNNAVSTTSTFYILGSTTSIANVVVSDAWTNATTRVTDGSVKSIFRQSTAGSVSFNADTSGTPTVLANNTFDMSNSYIVPGPSTGAQLSINIKGRDSTYNIAQATMYSSGTNLLTVGTNTYPSKNITVTIKTTNLYYAMLGGTSYFDSSTFNFTNFYIFYSDWAFGVAASPPGSVANNTFNFTNFTSLGVISSSWLNFGTTASQKITINFSGIVDFIPASTPLYALQAGGGDVSINLLPSATVYKGRRATTGANTLTGRYFPQSVSGYFLGQKIPIYTANLLPTVSATANVAAGGPFFSITLSTYSGNDLYKPTVINIEYPGILSSANSQHTTVPANVLMTYRDGSRDPIEILGIDTKIGYTASGAATTFPNVFRDTITVRTTGPSLKSLLTTRTAGYWQPSANAAGISDVKSSSYKNIKIPIVSGSTYTITGYIRSDYASSITGDVIMSVIYNNTVLATQSMTSAMYNAWEQFTLSFTASATGEAYLVWEMYYPTAMSYWLDDLVIVKA